MSLPFSPEESEVSFAAALLHGSPHVLDAFPPKARTVQRVAVFDVSGRPRLIDPDKESWGPASQALSTDPSHTLWMFYTMQRARSGLWAITSAYEDHTIHVAYGGALTEEQRSTARDLFVRDPEVMRWAGLGQAGARGLAHVPSTRNSWRFLGYVHDTASALVLLAGVASLSWVGAIPRLIRARRERRAFAGCRCARCKYSLAGIDSTVCPECGAIVRDEPGTK